MLIWGVGEVVFDKFLRSTDKLKTCVENEDFSPYIELTPCVEITVIGRSKLSQIRFLVIILPKN